MFEVKPPHTGAATPLDLSGGLKPVTWSELVARLDAARGLRVDFRSSHAEGDGSFDPGSARHIAALSGGKPDVNLDDLANGKVTDGISLPHEARAADRDPRE